MSLSPISLNPGSSITYIDESELYDSTGIKINYGYNGRNVYGDEASSAYAAIMQTPGLHNIHISRQLTDGEEIRLHWRNGCDLIFFCDDGKTKVKKVVGGTYQEIGKWADEDGHSENTCLKFEDDVLTKRFDYIETKTFKEF